MVWVYVSIFCVSDAFVCSVMVAVAERCKFLAKIAPEALLPGANGEVTSYCNTSSNYRIMKNCFVLPSTCQINFRMMGKMICLSLFPKLILVLC
jgi:hypothetical protein